MSGQFKDFPYDPEPTQNEIQQVDLAISGVKIIGGQQLDKQDKQSTGKGNMASSSHNHLASADIALTPVI